MVWGEIGEKEGDACWVGPLFRPIDEMRNLAAARRVEIWGTGGRTRSIIRITMDSQVSPRKHCRDSRSALTDGPYKRRQFVLSQILLYH